MATVPGFLLTHTISVRAKTGTGPFGATYAAAVAVKAHVIAGKPIVVRVGAEEVTADTVAYTKPSATCPEGSLVTYSGEVYRVLKRTAHSAPGLPTPDHIKLVLVPHTEG